MFGSRINAPKHNSNINCTLFPDSIVCQHLKNNIIKAHSKQLRSLAPSNARARDAKLVLSFKTLKKYRALSDLLRSLIVSRVPRQMLAIA